MNDIYKRLDSVANQYFGSLSNLAIIMGLKNQTFYSYKNREIGELMLNRLKDIGINPDYLLHNKLPKILAENYNYSEVKNDIVELQEYDYKSYLIKLLTDLENGTLTIKQMKELNELIYQIIDIMDKYIKLHNKINNE